MAMRYMRELLDHATSNGYGIPVANVSNLERVCAVLAAADEAYPHVSLGMYRSHGQCPMPAGARLTWA